MCIFCKIINGEIPSSKVYEDDKVLAILDISQATYGHTLVLPKKHYDNLLTIDDDIYQDTMLVAKKLAKAINQATSSEGVNILNNCNAAAGQTVMLFHVHIIPRKKNDDVKIEFTEHKYDLNEVKEKIIKAL